MIFIDSLRNNSGGAKYYLDHLLRFLDDNNVSYWVFTDRQDVSCEGVVIRAPSNIVLSFFYQLLVISIFARIKLPRLLFATDSSSVSIYSKKIVLNQDILAFEFSEQDLSDSSFGSRLRLKIIKFIQIQNFRLCDTIIILTDAARRFVEPYVRDANVEVIPHFFKRNTQISDSPPFRFPYILNVSPFFRYKNIDETLYAFSEILKENPNLMYIIIGQINTLYYVECVDIVKRLGIEANVIFKGGMSNTEVLHYLKHAYMAVYSSSCEAFGITLLEYVDLSGRILCKDYETSRELTLDKLSFYTDADDFVESFRSVSTLSNEDRVMILDRFNMDNTYGRLLRHLL